MGVDRGRGLLPLDLPRETTFSPPYDQTLGLRPGVDKSPPTHLGFPKPGGVCGPPGLGLIGETSITSGTLPSHRFLPSRPRALSGVSIPSLPVGLRLDYLFVFSVLKFPYQYPGTFYEPSSKRPTLFCHRLRPSRHSVAVPSRLVLGCGDHFSSQPVPTSTHSTSV